MQEPQIQNGEISELHEIKRCAIYNELIDDRIME